MRICGLFGPLFASYQTVRVDARYVPHSTSDQAIDPSIKHCPPRSWSSLYHTFSSNSHATQGQAIVQLVRWSFLYHSCRRLVLLPGWSCFRCDRVLGSDPGVRTSAVLPVGQMAALRLPGSVVDLFEALSWKRLDRRTLVDRARLVVAEKELEVVKARAENEVEVVKAQAEARVLWAEARATKAELETAAGHLKAKNLEILRLRHSVNLRRAIESFQEEEVLPRLGLKPTSRVTVGMWERFMQARPDIRRHVERQTPWRKSKVAAEMGHIYTTLPGRIHSSHQIGDAAVVIGTDLLTTEECLGVGALLYDFVPIEFHPPELMEKFEKNEREDSRPCRLCRCTEYREWKQQGGKRLHMCTKKKSLYDSRF
ncbi:hypothetical protein Naga_100406g7 [Nannochloropsis gaditana]|uniref:Uncharacterized protein n=1 Tax=Nannochloropsis gaditana TaxID=72520 RepID=W7TH89_9STRA|nr:hypothetical protein Naga_100406g7 [Nannochloropsis gaditana]